MPDPGRPTFQSQDPADNGCKLGWLSCTCYACAMLLDRALFGQTVPKGCTIRTRTGDTVGGTTLPQVCKVAHDYYHITLEQHVGSNVASYAYAARQLRHGRAFILQGNTHPLLNTQFRATQGNVNHAVEVNEGRHWNATTGLPGEVLVFDSAANGRKRLYHVDQGPSWWPWSLACQFAAALRPWGDDDTRTLGLNRMYAAFQPVPTITLRYNGSRLVLQPDHMRINVAAGHRANVRIRPDALSSTYIHHTLGDNTPWYAYQKTHGATPSGASSDVWYGDYTGNRWVHVSNLTNIGGT